MNATALYWPMLTQIGLSLAVLFWLAYSRVSRIAKHGMPEIRKTGFPAHVNNASDNFKNQFEVPVLFYALCFFFIVSGEVTPFVLALAWVFAIGRVIHALIQLTKNVIFPYRFGVFLITVLSALALFVIAILQLVSL